MNAAASYNSAGFGIARGEKRFPCAELVDLTWSAPDEGQHREFAILAEVWTSGGVLLVDEPAHPGTEIHISLPHGTIPATVTGCREENCSWAMEVQVDRPEDWFGGRYEPAVLILGEVFASRPRSGPQLVRPENPVANMLRTTLRRQAAVQSQPRAL